MLKYVSNDEGEVQLLLHEKSQCVGKADGECEGETGTYERGDYDGEVEGVPDI